MRISAGLRERRLDPNRRREREKQRIVRVCSLPAETTERILRENPLMVFDAYYGTGLRLKKFYGQGKKGVVEVPEGVDTIYSYTFYQCLMSGVKLPESLRVIETDAFQRCNNLKEVTLPPYVKMGYSPFEDCKGLERVYMSFYTFRDRNKMARNFVDTMVVDGVEVDMRRRSYFSDNLTEYAAVCIVGRGKENAPEESFRAAEEYVENNRNEILKAFCSAGDAMMLEKLLELPITVSLSALEQELEKSNTNEQHEIYVMLLKYKEKRFGFDAEGGSGEERFIL